MGQYRLEFFEDEDGDQPVRRWSREELTRTQRLVVGTAMREVLEEVGIDVCGSEYGRQLGQGLFEFRLPDSAEETRASGDRRGPSSFPCAAKSLPGVRRAARFPRFR